MKKNQFKLAVHPPVVSLQIMTSKKIITTVCNNQQLLNMIIDMQEGFQMRLCVKTGKEFKGVEALASELINKICKCTKLKEMMLELLWPMAYRIMLWKSIYAPFLVSNEYLQFYWTNRGRIDNVRTAKHIIYNENIEIRRRFTLACSLCLRKEIHGLWSKMTNGHRTYFQNRNSETIRPILLFWVFTMKRLPNLKYIHNAFKCAVKSGFLEAIKYFFSICGIGRWSKNDLAVLGEDYLKAKVNTTFYIEEDEIDFGYLMFSKMWNCNQLNTFHSNSALTLFFILHSSEHKFFIQELTKRLPFTSSADVESLLYLLFYNYHLEVRTDHDYCTLFVDVWRMVPASVKNLIRAKPSFGRHFLEAMIKGKWRFLLKKEFANNVRLMSAIEPYISPYYFDVNKWEFLYFLIEEGIATIPSLIKYRSFLLKFLEEKQMHTL